MLKLATDEQFKPIANYEDYQISNLGRVFDLANRKFVHPRFNHCGYAYVRLVQNIDNVRVRSNRYIDKLVCEAFIGDVPDFHMITHKNTVKTDNRLFNLMYENIVTSGAYQIVNEPYISKCYNIQYEVNNGDGTVSVRTRQYANKHLANEKLKQVNSEDYERSTSDSEEEIELF